MSIDPPYVPEFAQAGFLAPMPPAVEAAAREDRVPELDRGLDLAGPPRRRAVLGQHPAPLVPQVRGRGDAGLDMSRPVTWDQLIQAAARAQDADRRAGHPGRVADGVGQRPRRVRRRLDHRERRRGRPRRWSSSASTPRPASRPRAILRTFGDAGGRPARVPDGGRGHQRASPSSRARPRSWSTSRSSGGRRRPPSRRARCRQSVARRLRLDASTRRPRRTGPARRRSAASTSASARSASTRTSPTRRRRASSSPENQSYYFVSNGNPSLAALGLRRPGGRWRSSRWPPVIRDSLDPGRAAAADRRTTPRSPAASSGPSTRRASVTPERDQRGGDDAHHRGAEEGGAAVTATTGHRSAERPPTRTASGGTGDRPSRGPSAGSAGTSPAPPSS